MTGQSGTAYGVGIGPGDPDLITLKAHRLLQSAPVVAFPAPESGDSLARAIAAPHIPDGKIEIAIRMPMLVDRFPAKEVYRQAAADIGAHLAAGRDVAVLCEGDPFFYGSFMYLFARLADDYAVEVVPGVSSLTACAAAVAAPLASRNDVLAVIPAPLPAATIAERLAAVEAAAIIKIGRHFGKVREILQDMDLAADARYIEHATMRDQRILPLDQVQVDGAPYFSMILVHRRGEAWQ